MIFPKHKCSMTLTHNRHLDYYDTAAQFIADDRNAFNFKSAEAVRRSIDTNEIWELQWYPDTPIGYYSVAAPTLDEVLVYAFEVEAGA